jgi:ribosomal-protein-alanine N-acetyltransferase
LTKLKSSVAVASARRGRGSGTPPASSCICAGSPGLGAYGVFEVEESNMPARRLYRRAGFHDVGRREGYYRDPSGSTIAALVLRRDL